MDVRNILPRRRMGGDSDGDSGGDVANAGDEGLDHPGDGGEEGLGLLGGDSGKDATDDDCDNDGDDLG